MTNLKALLAEATVDSTNLTKATVEWTRKVEGKATTSTLDIFIVVDVSFAASDRIYLGTAQQSNDPSRMARVIAERVRFGENGEEAMTFEQAAKLQPSLGWALVIAVNEFDKTQITEEDEEGAKD